MDIYEHIPLGKENAIHSCDLEEILGCECSSELRRMISTARINGTADGTVICSNSSDGYWRSRDIAEIRRFVRSMHSRATQILMACEPAEKILEALEGENDG